MTDRLTYADKTRIVKDWAAQFPDMSVDRRTMTIWKRVGPLLMYISIYTRANVFPSYEPQWAIHTLYRKLPSAGSMAFKYALHSINWKIGRLPDNWNSWGEELKLSRTTTREKYYTMVSDSLHYDKHLKAAEDIKNNAWIKPEHPVSLHDIWQGAENFLQNRLAKNIFWSSDYETTIPIFAAIWAGEEEKAREYLKWWEGWISTLDARRLNQNPTDLPNQGERESREDYRKQILYYMDHPDELRQIVKDEIVKHKLEKVLYQNITGTKYQE